MANPTHSRQREFPPTYEDLCSLKPGSRSVGVGAAVAALARRFGLIHYLCIFWIAVGVGGPVWAQVSPNPLFGWEQLKFGMTPRQACDVLNRMNQKCTIEVRPTNQECAELRRWGQECIEQTKRIVLGDMRVTIGSGIWQLGLGFANIRPEDEDIPRADIGNLDRIELSFCDPRGCNADVPSCNASRFLQPLEARYGPFTAVVTRGNRVTSYPEVFVKEFANGAEIRLSLNHLITDDCRKVTVSYNDPAQQRPVQQPPPPPPPPTAHF